MSRVHATVIVFSKKIKRIIRPVLPVHVVNVSESLFTTRSRSDSCDFRYRKPWVLQSPALSKRTTHVIADRRSLLLRYQGFPNFLANDVIFRARFGFGGVSAQRSVGPHQLTIKVVHTKRAYTARTQRPNDKPQFRRPVARIILFHM